MGRVQHAQQTLLITEKSGPENSLSKLATLTRTRSAHTNSGDWGVKIQEPHATRRGGGVCVTNHESVEYSVFLRRVEFRMCENFFESI
jgi:hypothetical protein